MSSKFLGCCMVISCFNTGKASSVGRIRRLRRHPALAPHDCRMATLPHLIRPTGAQPRTY
ncbi:hypothetical protein CIT292_09403 [Citrobacter youngae ATCC 29220]|uniref:Uncharacterized protein n=1 Tax=Citrobacter youngae ATCC 29220 TaxID=500640 RepID=D4BF36_9ENTR|nr:hypothetical protein CIT292_09403 [Citrobacter youngae ATCC 29220]